MHKQQARTKSSRNVEICRKTTSNVLRYIESRAHSKIMRASLLLFQALKAMGAGPKTK